MTLQDCFTILNIEPGCDWEALRTAYRRQVQKWHPDRYHQDPAQQAEAAERILAVYQAYEQLSDYFQRHGQLPPAEPKPQVEPEPKPEPEPAPEPPPPPEPAAASAATPGPEPADIFSAPPPVKRSQNKGMWIAIVLILTTTYVIVSNIDPSPKKEYGIVPPTAGELEAVDDTEEIAAIETPMAMPKPRKLPGFNRGATPGEVFAAQGVPTRTIGDIWYYGQSEVHFDRGVVVRWHNTTGNPLNIRETKHKADKTEPAKAKKNW